MYKLIIILFSVALLSQDYWVKANGTNDYVFDIFVDESNPSNVVVCSDRIQLNHDFEDLFPSIFESVKGWGIQISRNSGADFTEFQTLDSSVALTLTHSSSSPNQWIASGFSQNRSVFYLSNDAGANWERIETECDESLDKIVSFARSGDKLFGGALSVGNGLFEFSDDMQACTNDENLVVSIREIKYQNEKLYIASDDFVSSGVYISSDNGQSWQKSDLGLENLRIHTVDAPPVYQELNVVYAGADEDFAGTREGKGIFISRDGGLSWAQQDLDGVTVYDIEHHPLYSEFMVAACGKNGVYISANGGSTWENTYMSGLSPEADVRTITIPAKELGSNGYEVYIGTFGQGMYYSQGIMPTLTNVENNIDDIEVSIFPNPTIEFVNINLNKIQQNVNVQLLDLTGKELYTNQFVNSSSFKINFPNSLKSGIYFLNINSDELSVTEKIVID